MKNTPVQLLLAAAIVSCVYLIACQKQTTDPQFLAAAKGNEKNRNGHDNANGGTSTNTSTCYYGQGYWFGSGKRTWPDLNGGTVSGTITIGSFNYSQDDAWSIWKSSNSGGKKDAKKAFVLLSTLQLSGPNVPMYTNMDADVAMVTNWLNGLGALSGSNLPASKMPSDVKAAYNRLKDWMENHECEDDDDEEDETCTTEWKYWFGDEAHNWPDVNGTADANVTIAGNNYTAADAAAAWNFYKTSSLHDPQKALILLAVLRLSGTPTNGYSGMATDIATVETWLQTFGRLSATNNPTTAMPTDVADAYNRLTNWLDDHDCDDDDDD